MCRITNSIIAAARSWLGGTLLLGLAILAAAESPRVPGPMASLEPMAALCATEPASSRFNDAWFEWLRSYPNADVDEAIRRVVTKARTLRSLSLPGLAAAPVAHRMSDEDIAAHMQKLARTGPPNPQIRVIASEGS